MEAQNPRIEEIVKDAWIEVIENAKSGFIHILLGDSVYYQTYRLTGDDEPSALFVPGDDGFEGVPIYYRNERIAGETKPVGTAGINSSVPIDIYIYSQDVDGRVRVDQGA